MIKRVVSVAGILFFLLVFQGKAADLVKVAFVDMDRAFNEYVETQKAIQELNKEFTTRRKEFIKLENEITSLKEEFSTQEALLSQEEKLQKAEEINQKILNLEKYRRDVQMDLARREESMTRKLIAAIYNVIEEIGTKEGYTLVLKRDSIFYGGEEMDLTDEVVKKLNKKKGKSE